MNGSRGTTPKSKGANEMVRRSGALWKKSAQGRKAWEKVGGGKCSDMDRHSIIELWTASTDKKKYLLKKIPDYGTDMQT